MFIICNNIKGKSPFGLDLLLFN